MSEIVPNTLLARGSHAPADAAAPDRALAPVRRMLRWTSLVLIGAMIAIPAIQVVMREAFNLPFIGAEELTRFMLICLVFITLPYVIVSGSSIRLEEGLLLMPASLQRITRVAIAMTSTLAFTIAAASVGVAMLRNLQNATPTLGIPYWIFFAASLIGFLVAAVESALQLWKALTGRPLFVTFRDEVPPDDMSALEAALVAEAARGAAEVRK
jgi:TRAP-type C4-dicarboxylate transport system permease small subunit